MSSASNKVKSDPAYRSGIRIEGKSTERGEKLATLCMCMLPGCQ